LYPAMEDFTVPLVEPEPILVPLYPFTLVGATTRSGSLSAPLRDRFRIRQHLVWYSEDEIASILTSQGFSISPEAIDVLASVSRGTPRIALSYLQWARDYGVESKKDALSMLDKLQIDSVGLTNRDYQYLTTLREIFSGGPVGVRTLSSALGISTDTLVDEIEPYLLRLGIIKLTPQGRKLV